MVAPVVAEPVHSLACPALKVHISDCKYSHLFQSGRRRTAAQPRPLFRFSSVSAPLRPYALWRRSRRPMPEPPALVVKKGTKRLDVLDKPGPSSSMLSSMTPLTFLHDTCTPPPVSIDASTALRTRLIKSCSN